MSEAPTESKPGPGRLGPWFAAIWLFFLLEPVAAGWRDRDTVRGVAGLVATLVFAAAYLTLWIRARRDQTDRGLPYPPLGFAVAAMVALAALGTLMVLLLGEVGIAASVYVAVAAVLVLPVRAAGVVVVADAVLVIVLGGLPHWDSQFGTAFGILAASLGIFGLRLVISRNIELVNVHRRNADLAVENERSRFARDLHDILGHSLTVITVKAELANRLLESDAPAARERARTEVADLERLARDALADVRRAVGGYRELSLTGELVRARNALATADIEAELPGSTEEVPGPLQELFAWTVREGVTNVIRHSGARHCRVVVGAARCAVEDDGAGTGEAPSPVPGNGLAGLRERCVVAGAVLVTGPARPHGFRLEVRLP